MQDLDAARLLEPGSTRSAAITAGAAAIKMSVGICGDRARALAASVLDAAIPAAQEARS